jgi:hypothetical protein
LSASDPRPEPGSEDESQLDPSATPLRSDHSDTGQVDPAPATGGPPPAGPGAGGYVLGLLLLFGLFLLGGVLVWWLTDLVSRSDISGDGWSLRGNGALIVPVVLGPAIMAAGWAGLAVWLRGQKGGLLAAVLAAGLAIVVAGLAGFAPILWPGIPIPLLMLLLAFGAGLGLASQFGRPRLLTFIVSLVTLAVAFILGELSGGSVVLVAPLLAPLLVALPLLTAAPKADAPGRHAPRAVAALAYLAVPIGVVGGFMLATFLAPRVLAANDPARANHTATLLADGRVLVAGGAGDHGPTASVHIWEPTSGRWTPAASMSVPRAGHFADRLTDGRVLAVGGTLPGADAGAEVYDPRADDWTATIPMATARSGGSGVMLGDGQVVIAGGWGDAGPVTTVEVLDPATLMWAARGTLQGNGPQLPLVALPDGNILALGSRPPLGASPEIYHPATGASSPAATPPMTRVSAAVLLPDGRVLALGGGPELGGAPAAALYEPVSNTWSSTAAPGSAPFDGSTLTLLPDNRVLLAGGTVLSGSPPRGEVTAAAQIYDPASGTWSPTADMTSPRSGHTATLLADGRVLVVGGATRAGALASAEIFDPRSGAWQATSSIG